MYSSAVVPLVTLLQSTTHASKQLLHIMNEMNSVTPSGKAAAAANLKPFATLLHIQWRCKIDQTLKQHSIVIMTLKINK